MKSLDEVIDIFEKACDLDRRCEDCSGCLAHDEGCPNDGANAVPDALHYLKDMKNLEEDYDILYNKYWREFNQQQVNPQLTWDELLQMEGKPVWVEFLNDEGEWNGEWCLVESSNNLMCEILRCKMSWWGLRKITLGKTWQAYRKDTIDPQ